MNKAMRVSDIKLEVTREVEKYIKIARSHYNNPNIPFPTVEFSKRMTSKSGMCTYLSGGSYALKFSLSIIEDNDFEVYKNRTVPHEVAHIIQHFQYCKMDHGNTFQYIMRDIFKRSYEQSTRCHNYTVPLTKRRSPKMYTYLCPTCKQEFNLSAIRHGKALKGATYSHSNHQALVYTGKVISK